MKTLIVALAASYIAGGNPWCMAMQNGDLRCYYVNYDSCLYLCGANPLCAVCVPNPERE